MRDPACEAHIPLNYLVRAAVLVSASKHGLRLHAIRHATIELRHGDNSHHATGKNDGRGSNYSMARSAAAAETAANGGRDEENVAPAHHCGPAYG